MKKSTTCSTFLLGISVLLSTAVLAQTEIAGKVTDEAKRDELAGISIAVKGKVIGTITDQKGNFSLSTSTPTPFTIAVSGVGFQTQEFVISRSRRDLNVSLKEQVTDGAGGSRVGFAGGGKCAEITGVGRKTGYSFVPVYAIGFVL